MKPAIFLGLVSLALASTAWGHTPDDDMLSAVRFDQRLDAQVPGALPFTDEAGTAVTFDALYRERPVVLAFAYYHCANLCSLVLDGLAKSIDELGLTPGRDFSLVTVSIDPADTPADARAKRLTYASRIHKPIGDQGWRFLTGATSAVGQLASTVGFGYRYDPGKKQFAHAAGVVVLTPGGRVSKYLYGVQFAPRDLRLALVEASAGQIGSPIDQLLLRCYHYDPKTGRYGLLVMALLRAFGLATSAALGIFLVHSWRKERERDAR